MTRRVLIAFFITSFCFQYAFAQYPLKHKPGIYKIIARSGLNMRDAADLNGKVIARIPYGADVQLIDDHFAVLTVGWMQGHWSRINYEGKKGYVFSPYLSQLPLPEVKLENNCESDIYGLEVLLMNYINQFLKKSGAEKTIYETPPHFEENRKRVTMQWYENNIHVVRTGYYESGSTALRVPGTDIYQAFAFLEALLKLCPESQAQLKNLSFIKDQDGQIIEIRDKEYDGYYFRIRQIDAATAEIEMSSGV